MSPFGRRKEPGTERRSSEDRERARQERERRRAQRHDRSQPELPDAGAEPPAVVEQRPSWLESPPPQHATTTEHEVLDDAAGVVTIADARERPVQLRRAVAPSVRDLPKIAGPHPPRYGGRSRRRLRRLLALLVPLALLAAIAWFLNALYQPLKRDSQRGGSVRITIPSGATAGDVGQLLARKGVVDSKFFFELRARLSGKRDDLKAGTYTLAHGMSYAAALDALTVNPPAPRTIKVTIPEGRSIAEAAPLIRQADLKGSYVKATEKPVAGFAFHKTYNVPEDTHSLEGFLFPATYELKPGASVRSLVAQQLDAFQRTFKTLDLRVAHRKHLTPYDVLIIASMIEREAGIAKDRRLISAVIYNRLKQDMPLGIDATLRYRLRQWSKPLRVSELNTNSAFNTRKHAGLPPTPIGNPGLASLRAAVDPAHVPYLFYVVRPCGNGAHAFSATDAQFQRDLNAYNRKREQLGGKDPSHC